MSLDTVPLPPKEYIDLVCGPFRPQQFDWAGKLVVQMLDGAGMLGAEKDLLDVGCGCGRVARYLLDRPLRSYMGFDRHPGMVKWAVDEITRRDSRFAFRHVDVRSAYVSWDGQGGSIAADALRFPFPDAAFDSALLASVFTHMPLREARHYLGELRRVLRPGGKILLSVFFAERRPWLYFFSRVAPYVLVEANFFYTPRAFARCLARSGLAFQALGPQGSGYYQNWYVLTKRGP